MRFLGPRIDGLSEQPHQDVEASSALPPAYGPGRLSTSRIRHRSSGLIDKPFLSAVILERESEGVPGDRRDPRCNISRRAVGAQAGASLLLDTRAP
jgi:hypothetical protein